MTETGVCVSTTPYMPQPLPHANIISWSVNPKLVNPGNPSNDTATVTWAAQNAYSCDVVNNTTDDAWSGTSGQRQSQKLTTQTTFTLTCVGEDGGHVTQSQTVNIVPNWQEN